MAKLYELAELQEIIAKERQAGKRVVFTNGCFDILHAGHVTYLRSARDQGDRLVVGLNSDQSVRALKGNLRPIVTQTMRAQVLSGLECVDYITIFYDPDPLQVILTIKPDVLVKGTDWEESQIIGACEVKADGGKVICVPLVRGISTSEIIRRIVAKHVTP